jgi:hypothetical protein
VWSVAVCSVWSACSVAVLHGVGDEQCGQISAVSGMSVAHAGHRGTMGD